MRRFLRFNSAGSLIEALQEWFRFLTPSPGGLSVLWEEEGGIMDPNG
jgi:hypothetical protein